MTTYTDNLRIPLLESNTFQPEIVENMDKVITDIALAGVLTITCTDTSEYTIPDVPDINGKRDWQNYVIDIIGDPTADGKIIRTPIYQKFYAVFNNTAYTVNIGATGQITPISLPANSNSLIFCLNSELVRVDFIADSNSFVALADTPGDYSTSSAGYAVITNGTNDGLIFYDLPALETTIAAKLDTIGGVIKNYGETRNDITFSSSITIDIADGNVQTLDITGAISLTLSTTHTDTSLTLLIDSAGTNITWITTIKWPDNTEPTLSANSKDIIILSRINSIWYGNAVTGYTS